MRKRVKAKKCWHCKETYIPHRYNTRFCNQKCARRYRMDQFKELEVKHYVSLSNVTLVHGAVYYEVRVSYAESAYELFRFK